ERALPPQPPGRSGTCLTMDDVAVIGLGCLFPGASTPGAFWENLLAGRDCTSDLTARHLGVDPSVVAASQKGVADRIYILRGGNVGELSFDPREYALQPEALAGLDVLFRWPLYVAREALRDARLLGSPALARCGLALGSLSFPTRSSHRLIAPLYYRA